MKNLLSLTLAGGVLVSGLIGVSATGAQTTQDLDERLEPYATEFENGTIGFDLSEIPQDILDELNDSNLSSGNYELISIETIDEETGSSLSVDEFSQEFFTIEIDEQTGEVIGSSLSDEELAKFLEERENAGPVEVEEIDLGSE
ncbi:hypothetical protein [Bacillus sp. SM2101]|uniref:hypothetical protein n=1 Tax=Bacillus sp. SM2101 TaxID=2805366 RepID=UPI001BDDD079|nr:hypothetical protein [Bacillus sp. SM2101]